MVRYKLLATGLVIMVLATELQVLLHASMPLLLLPDLEGW